MRLKYNLPIGGAEYAPYLIDMIENNHTLIAGATGAGKSVLENAIIYALLCECYPGKPDNGRGARFIFIDPKQVELIMYKDLPHTLLYADNMPDIVNALKHVRNMIDTRLKAMRAAGIRKSNECPVYVFIDELVDLVTNKEHKKDIITTLSDCISISRCTNIYFVILTQAPNRRILLPEIVLNCNCRCALFCNYPYESREIIGDDTATKLPFHGVGIVQQNIERYQIKIPFYNDHDILNIVRHWTKQHRIYNKQIKSNKTSFFARLFSR